MFERYTEQARRALFFARYEATQKGGLAIEVEHLLLGLIRESEGVIRAVFRRGELSAEELCRELENHFVFRKRVATSVEMPFAPGTKRVLQFAAQEADALDHSDIGTEHLLLGILREESSPAARLLVARGVTLAAARAGVAEFVKSRPQPIRRFLNSVDRFEVRVSPSEWRAEDGTFAKADARSWVAVGFRVRPLIAQVCEVDEDRVQCPLQDISRYDCVVVLPRGKDPAEPRALARDAIARYFDLRIDVVDTPDGKRASVVSAR
jgi:Clp amino terminal domain, pathogenicity island component